MISKNNIFSFIFLLTSFLFFNLDVFASHYRAGEITYSWLYGRTYQITVYTYTDPTSNANVNTLSIQLDYGDGSAEMINRASPQDPVLLNNTPVTYIVKNTYIATHTYQADGDYLISLTDQNRVDGIFNINAGNTLLIPFYIETELIIDNFYGHDRSPILLIPPVDRGCGGFKYVYNPGAYDPDGDSLYFDLVTPMQGKGVNVPAYSDPSPNFSINHQTGQIIWNTPPIITSTLARTYNIAIEVTEYRNGIKIGFIERDMQIRIENCVNSPPVIDPMPNNCVEAGKPISPLLFVRATDPNTSQTISLVGYGAPFTPSISKYLAVLNPPNPQGNPVSAQVSWQTDCSNIMYEPYQLFMKATDNYAIPLSDYNFSYITVIGPSPKNVQLKQIGNGFRITWNADACKLASAYKIYKRIDSSNWIPDHCFRGVDPSKFTLIGTLDIQNNPINDTSFYDDQNGEGLSPLINYCYRIVAVYPPRDSKGTILYGTTADSYASVEVCGEIIRSKPIITNVSVNNTSNNQGSIYLHWLKPITLDSVNYPPPYHIVLKRSTSLTSTYIPFDSLSYPTFNSITDSSYIDTLINTLQNQYYYKIDFNSAQLGNLQFIDVSPTASSIQASVYSTDRENILSWYYKVPWSNNQFIIYRKNLITNNFDTIGYSTTNSFLDTGLVNGTNYCYVIKSLGDYSQFLYDTLVNFSQQICGTPIDTIKPCAPILTLTPPCNSFSDLQNELKWIPVDYCSGDVIYYKIYYKRLKTDAYVLLDSVSKNIFQYTDLRPELKSSIAGCYVVTGVDSSANHNESFFTNEACTDNCPQYSIPNVFTPNGDGKNDTLKPFPYRFVDKIDITIFDRWGLPVFTTKNLDINWDGKDQDSKVDCTDGVYFYICDIYEIFLEGVKKRTIRGTIQILR